MSDVRSETALLIVFTDLSRFAAQSLRESDSLIANVLDSYYEKVATATLAAGGNLVKCIGDGILIVFPESAIDAGWRRFWNSKTPSIKCCGKWNGNAVLPQKLTSAQP
jgi:hypothetical protein